MLRAYEEEGRRAKKDGRCTGNRKEMERKTDTRWKDLCKRWKVLSRRWGGNGQDKVEKDKFRTIPVTLYHGKSLIFWQCSRFSLDIIS